MGIQFGVEQLLFAPVVCFPVVGSLQPSLGAQLIGVQILFVYVYLFVDGRWAIGFPTPNGLRLLRLLLLRLRLVGPAVNTCSYHHTVILEFINFQSPNYPFLLALLFEVPHGPMERLESCKGWAETE